MEYPTIASEGTYVGLTAVTFYLFIPVSFYKIFRANQ